MIVSSEEKLQKVQSLVSDIAVIEQRFSNLLEGFKLYNQYKGILDIEVYEKSLSLFTSAIIAMESELIQFNRLILQLQKALN